MEEISSLIGAVVDLIKAFPGLPVAAKIAGVLTLSLSLVKSSLLRPYWDKLGSAKVFVAPVIALAIAVLSTHPLTWAAVLQGLSGGALAIALHEILDAVKAIPGIGSGLQSLIDLAEKLLLKPAAPAVTDTSQK